VQIGGYKLDDVIMDYSEDKSGELATSYHSGILGNIILDRFDIIIDFVNSDLYLKPNQEYNKSFTFSKLGFRFVDRSITKKAWIVAGLYKGSNAEIAGLKIDDKIISVNGIDIHQIPFKEQAEFWDKLDKVVLIVLRNGEEIRIEFDLEYVL
jgi:C-terminal processing protease CtpA/Prc